MSANNYILIQKSRNSKNKVDYLVKDIDADNPYMGYFAVGCADTLEKAIKMANKYRKENEVEYGLEFDI
jgi:hypothetical protein